MTIAGQINLGHVHVGEFTADETSLTVKMLTSARQHQVDQALLKTWPVPSEATQPDKQTKVDASEQLQPRNVHNVTALYVALESLGLDVLDIQEYDTQREGQP